MDDENQFRKCNSINKSERLRIVILNYNRADLTLLCVVSAQNQTYTPKDIVVVDNYSKEEDYQLLKKSLPDNVVLIRCNANLGYSAGNNQGIKTSVLPPCNYVMVLNNDVTFCDENTALKLVNAISNSDEKVACSPLVNTLQTGIIPEYQLQVRRVPNYATVLVSSSWWLRRIIPRLYKRYIYDEHRPYPRDEILDCETINGSCFVIKYQFIKEIGYLDEGTFLYFEELILGKQILERKKTACLVTSTSVLHHQGSTTMHTKNRFRFKASLEGMKSEVYYCNKFLHINILGIALLVIIRLIDNLTKLFVLKFLNHRSHQI